jgi:hypothetical protein
VATSNLQNGLVHRNVVMSIDPQLGQEPPYRPHPIEARVELALIEALHWLEVNAFLLPAPGTNGVNGFRVIGSRGLVRRPGESLKQLLERLDRAVQQAMENDIFTDEINSQRKPTR